MFFNLTLPEYISHNVTNIRASIIRKHTGANMLSSDQIVDLRRPKINRRKRVTCTIFPECGFESTLRV